MHAVLAKCKAKGDSSASPTCMYSIGRLHSPSPFPVSQLRTKFAILPLDPYVYVEPDLEQSEYPNLDELR
jgi:hypothetical protein